MIIGIDPHKATHMAVAIDSDEHAVGRLEVRADRVQTRRLLAWAAPLGEDRMWAIESADGLGKLLSQQLVAAGEHVVDVPPTLSARVRLLGSAKAGKNDGNDALSTAIAGLRHCGLRAGAAMTTRRCCGCWSVAMTTSSRCAPRPRVVCTRCYASSWRVALLVDCPLNERYDRKLAEGKTKKEALRALKRRISDAVWLQLQIDLAARSRNGVREDTQERL